MIDVILNSSTEIYRKLRKNEVFNEVQKPYTFNWDRILYIFSKNTALDRGKWLLVHFSGFQWLRRDILWKSF